MSRTNGRIGRHVVTALVLLGCWAFLLSYFQPSLLLLDTMNAGGDTPSFLRPIHHLRDVLLPAGNPLAFDLGNFGGYAPYQFYFLPPSLGIIALSTLMPFNVAFKLMTAVGTFLLPLTTALALRGLRLAWPAPALGAAGSLLFLFNEGNSMWGGNIQSTLAGEFAFSLAFSLAVLFLGLLYRGVETQRGWRSLGALLAFIGICHPVAFLNAAAPGLFFLMGRQHFVRNLRFVLAAYGTSVLLMGFWLIPLMAKLRYATSINWTWEFTSFSEVVPPILWPAAALAALDVIWVLLRRRPEDRPARYLAFSVLVTAVCFLNSTEAGLPEIRFLPFSYVLLILLAVDFIRRVLPVEAHRWPESFPLRLAPHAGVLAIALACAGFVHQSVSAIPAWIRWNYEGIESKPSYPLLQALTGELEGSISDPRVAYEHSPLHDRFGSMRIFEDMALFTGRATLEGVLLQTATMSPYIYWLQSQISKQGTHVIPGYPYPDFDPAHVAPRLALFNAHDVIARTPELRAGLDANPRFERRFVKEPYAIYRLEGADPNYVSVPEFEPALLDSREWKRGFHRWFARDEALAVPLIEASSVPAADRSLFPHVAEVADEPPRVAIDASCVIEEQIDHLEIAFRTTCPGKPHWISISYFPNWKAEGARGPFLASPGLMLVVPEGPEVRLEYRRLPVDWIGMVLSLLGLGICLAGLRAQPWAEPSGAWARGFDRAQPFLVAAGFALVVPFTVCHTVRTVGSNHLYERGRQAFNAKAWEDAVVEFERVRWLGPHSRYAADATFFRASSLVRAGEIEAALEGYETLIAEYPESIWVKESHYHAGQCLAQLGRPEEAAERFRFVIERFPTNMWARHSKNELKKLGQAGVDD
jgi:hypothetical protein